MARKSSSHECGGNWNCNGQSGSRSAKVARAGSLAKKELDDISKQVDALKRQLQRTAKRLKHALS